MRIVLVCAASCALELAVGGCATERGGVTEYLDAKTAVTIRETSAPIVYAHEVPEIAANVRDYLSLGAVEINNMGVRRHYLVLVSWSTIDRRAGSAQVPRPERVELMVGGHRKELTPVGHEARPLGIGDPPFRPPSGYVAESWYSVTPADLRALAATPPAEIVLQQDGDSVSYVTWRSAAAELEAFVRDIPDAAPAATRR